jgi:uncharacterized protein YecE (DUF72 family)
MGRARGRLRIGTSGYHYPHWSSDFYPAEVPARRWLAYYAGRFDTVEINNTFYGMPSDRTFDAWRDSVPEDFCFALKFSRYGSHIKRLKRPAAAIERFLMGARRLGERLGPILVQLPPRWTVDVERLDGFLDRAPRDVRWALEFRDPSWLCDPIYAVLRRHNAALCIHDLIEKHPRELTADWTYLRFLGELYGGSYTPQALTAEARRRRGWRSEGLAVFAYFNNDAEGYAPRNAADLRRFTTRAARPRARARA